MSLALCRFQDLLERLAARPLAASGTPKSHALSSNHDPESQAALDAVWKLPGTVPLAEGKEPREKPEAFLALVQ